MMVVKRRRKKAHALLCTLIGLPNNQTNKLLILLIIKDKTLSSATF